MTGLTLSPEVALPLLAYGEEVQPETARSMGYRLLLPTEPDPVADEVQALARRLQAVPYSDHWPATDLFCSVLLADGQRLVALVRYGLLDHTPMRRRGGLELIGVVTPATLAAAQAVQLYRGLVAKRGTGDTMPAFPPSVLVHDLQTTAAPPSSREPLPVLPVRLWQTGPMLFVASNPSDPDLYLRLLDQATSSQWQWLPLVGTDFPISTYARRGPLLAWTPHQTGVAIQLDPDPAPLSPEVEKWRAWLPWIQLGLLGLIALLLLVNLLLTWHLAARR
jgi:hypothetical protein